MTRYLDRHARSKDAYGGEPARSQQRQEAASDDPARKRAPGKKDPALCKAAHWKGPHQPQLRIQEYGWRRTLGCRWDISWRSPGDEPSWHCAHEEYCTGCGKVLRLKVGRDECPAFHEITGDERAEIERERAEREARVAAARTRSRWQPKPVIDGPQGYRRRR